jgi:hypothetical protein
VREALVDRPPFAHSRAASSYTGIRQTETLTAKEGAPAIRLYG